MTIGSVTSVTSALPADRTAAYQQAATVKPKATPTPQAQFQPAPALRPTIQDKIEIDQALLQIQKF